MMRTGEVEAANVLNQRYIMIRMKAQGFRKISSERLID